MIKWSRIRITREDQDGTTKETSMTFPENTSENNRKVMISNMLNDILR